MAILKKTFSLTIIVLLACTSAVLAIQTSSISGLGATKKVHAELVMPDGKGPFPAVLILHTSRGVKKEDVDYAQKLSRQGYACLIPHYFDPYSLTFDTRNWATSVYAESILEDFKSEINYLKSNPQIKKDKIGAVGFSMGGYWALILAGNKLVNAGVSYYGDLNTETEDPQTRYSFEEIFNKHSSPVLVLHGEDDMTVDVKYAKQLEDMLKGKFCRYELHIYPNAGHHFDRGNSLHKPAALDSWRRTLDFLKKYLQPDP